MTEGLLAQRTGIAVPDPIDFMQAIDAVTRALTLLDIARRADHAEHWRQRQNPAADRPGILDAWQASNALLSHTIGEVQATAAALAPLAGNAARALNLLEINMGMESQE